MGHDIFDLVIILTLVFFTIRGISQGFIAEAAGIVSLLVGFWVAKTYNGVLEPYLTFLSDPGWRSICACAILFIGAMIVVAVAARVLKKIISFSFASWADRLAGGLLGLAKGVIIWGLLLIIILNLFQNAEFVKDSRVIPYFMALIEQIRELLPPDIAAKITL